MRKCTRCKNLKPASSFSNNPKTGQIHGWCDDCRKKPMGKMKRFEYSCHVCGRAGGYSYNQERKTVWVCHDCKLKKQRAINEARRGDTVTKKLLIQQRGERCEKCGKAGKVIMHHIKEVAEGGKSTSDNLLLVCRQCHNEFHRDGRAKRIYR